MLNLNRSSQPLLALTIAFFASGLALGTGIATAKPIGANNPTSAPTPASVGPAVAIPLTAPTSIVDMLALPFVAETARDAGVAPGRLKDLINMLESEGPSVIKAAIEMEVEAFRTGVTRRDLGVPTRKLLAQGLSGQALLEALVAEQARLKQLPSKTRGANIDDDPEADRERGSGKPQFAVEPGQ